MAAMTVASQFAVLKKSQAADAKSLLSQPAVASSKLLTPENNVEIGDSFIQAGNSLST